MLGVVALVLGTVGDVVSCVVSHFSSLVGSTVGAEVLVESVLVHPQPVSKVTPKIKDKVRMLIFFHFITSIVCCTSAIISSCMGLRHGILWKIPL